MDGIDAPSVYKKMIECCWCDADERVGFDDLLSRITKLTVPRCLQKQFSVSDSDAINQVDGNFEAALRRLKCAT